MLTVGWYVFIEPPWWLYSTSYPHTCIKAACYLHHPPHHPPQHPPIAPPHCPCTSYPHTCIQAVCFLYALYGDNQSGFCNCIVDVLLLITASLLMVQPLFTRIRGKDHSLLGVGVVHLYLRRSTIIYENYREGPFIIVGWSILLTTQPLFIFGGGHVYFGGSGVIFIYS